MQDENRQRIVARLHERRAGLRAEIIDLDERISKHRALLSGYTAPWADDPCNDPDPWKQYLNGCGQ